MVGVGTFHLSPTAGEWQPLVAPVCSGEGALSAHGDIRPVPGAGGCFGAIASNPARRAIAARSAAAPKSTAPGPARDIDQRAGE